MKFFISIVKKMGVLFSILFSGCYYNFGIPQTGTDHCSGWSNEVRGLADKSWKYAQLSQNVYANSYDFNLDSEYDLLEEFKDDKMSYYSALFKGKKDGEYVFVFRGTDSFKDFKTGNNPYFQQQNIKALHDVTSAIKKYSIDKFIVTGHSLGGGMATHISLNVDNTTLYTFNGSPVFKQIDVKYDNERYSIVEKGEILKIVRLLAKEPDQLYTSINCTEGNPIEEHSMKKLAICLTQISAVNNNKEALESLQKNGLNKKWCH